MKEGVTDSAMLLTDIPDNFIRIGQANRALVTEFAQKVLVGADYSVLADYISTVTYDQHNPEAADGLETALTKTKGPSSRTGLSEQLGDES